MISKTNLTLRLVNSCSLLPQEADTFNYLRSNSRNSYTTSQLSAYTIAFVYKSHASCVRQQPPKMAFTPANQSLSKALETQTQTYLWSSNNVYHKCLSLYKDKPEIWFPIFLNTTIHLGMQVLCPAMHF